MPVQRLSGLDTAFLCLEDPEMPMTMGALALFNPEFPVQAQDVAGELARRAGQLDRLRESLRPTWFPPGGAEWVADPDFDAGDHVHIHQLRRPHRETDLTRRVAGIMAQPLNPRRPLWEIHVIAGLSGARFGLLVKLHHALADGAGAAALVAGLLDGFEPLPTAPPAPARPVLPDLREVARETWEVANIAAAVLRAARPAAALTALTMPPTSARRLATVRINRDDVLRVRKLHGGTTNDVVLAVLTTALRDSLLSQGHRVDGRTVRALVPVNVRKGGHDSGNHLSGYLCELPVGETDPAARLRAVRAEMDAHKAAGPARGAGAIPLLAGRVPTAIHRAAGPALRRSAALLFDTVITNVPVPDIPLRLHGAELEEVYPLVPLAHGVCFTAAIATYRNVVHIALQTTLRGDVDIDELAAAVPEALTALQQRETENEPPL